MPAESLSCGSRDVSAHWDKSQRSLRPTLPILVASQTNEGATLKGAESPTFHLYTTYLIFLFLFVLFLVPS